MVKKKLLKEHSLNHLWFQQAMSYLQLESHPGERLVIIDKHIQKKSLRDISRLGIETWESSAERVDQCLGRWILAMNFKVLIFLPTKPEKDLLLMN